MTKLGQTITKPQVTEDQIDSVFNKDKTNNIKNNKSKGKRIITVTESERTEKMCRPTFEIPESYHKKLQFICTAENVTIGKQIANIVTEWLDEIEINL